MKNASGWHPTRFLKKGDHFVANFAQVFPGSWMFCQRFIPYYTSAMQRFLHGSILDCGCGQVPYYEIYRDLVDEVTCVDWAFPPHATNHIDQIADLNKAIPFKDDRFDGIILTDVLEHLYRPAVALREICRTLKPGGKVVLGVPFFCHLHEQPHDFYRYTEYALRKLTEEARFEVVEIVPYGGYFEVIFDLLHKKLTRTKLMFWWLEALRKALLLVPPLKNLNKNWAKDYPLGYCMVLHKPT